MHRSPRLLRRLAVAAACLLAVGTTACTKNRVLGMRIFRLEGDPTRPTAPDAVAPRADVLVAAVAPPDRVR